MLSRLCRPNRVRLTIPRRYTATQPAQPTATGSLVKVWAEQNKADLLCKYHGKYVAISRNLKVVGVGDSETSVISQLEPQGERDPVCIILIHDGPLFYDGYSSLLPMDPSPEETDVNSFGTLTWDSIAHPKEYQVPESGFSPLGYFKEMPIPPKLRFIGSQRPIWTTTIPDIDGVPKIVSFIVDTSSPWSFLSISTCTALGVRLQAKSDWDVDWANFFLIPSVSLGGIEPRLSVGKLEEINLLGNNFLFQKKVIIHHKENVLTITE